MPVENDRFIISHRGVDTLNLISLKILLGILKGPFVLFSFKEDISGIISFSVVGLIKKEL